LEKQTNKKRKCIEKRRETDKRRREKPWNLGGGDGTNVVRIGQGEREKGDHEFSELLRRLGGGKKE